MPRPDGGQIEQQIIAAQLDLGTRSSWCCWKRLCKYSLVVLCRGEHEYRVIQKLPEGKLLVFQVKIVPVGDEDILKAPDFFQVTGIAQPGIRIMVKMRSTCPFSSRSTQPMRSGS